MKKTIDNMRRCLAQMNEWLDILEQKAGLDLTDEVEYNNVDEMPVDYLVPTALQTETFRVEVLREAIRRNLIRVEGRHRLKWMGNTRMLLIYFCGRVWSGDYPFKNKLMNDIVWKKGRMRFPNNDLCRVFDETNLKQDRLVYFDCPLPDGYKTVDELMAVS